MAFRFLHLADLHLASGFGGRPATKARLRAGILESFADAMQLARDQRLDAVLLAGDVYDDEKLTLRTSARFLDEVEETCRAGIDVLWVTGNHDPGAPGHRAADWVAKDLGRRADWTRRVHVFDDVTPRAVRVGDVGVVVGAGHPVDREARNLAATFPQPGELDVPRGRALVGLLHTQVEGASSEHARYAPSTHADFQARKYDYWALGHVHKRGRAVPGEPVYYSGNLMGRNAKPSECGAKGGYLVTVEPGRPAEPEFVELGRYRWERVALDTRVRTGAVAERLSAVRAAEHREGLLRALEGAVRAELPPDVVLGRCVLRVEIGGPVREARWLRDADSCTDLGDELGAALGCLELQLRGRGVHAEVDRSALEGLPTVLARALALHAEAAGADALEPALRRLFGSQERGGLELLNLPSEPDAREAYLRDLWRDLDALAIERLLGDPGDSLVGDA